MSIYLKVDSEQMVEIAISELQELREIIQGDPGWASTEDVKKDLKAINRVLDIYNAA